MCIRDRQEGVPAALKAECQVQIKTDGTVKAGNKALAVTGATEATLYISAATNFVDYKTVSANASKRATEYLK